jgi:hypothetical protein
MKLHTVVIVVSALILLLTTVVLAESDGRNRAGGYTAEAEVASGGNYRLTSLFWPGSATASGGDYRLMIASAPRPSGSGCCCTYLPCILR